MMYLSGLLLAVFFANIFAGAVWSYPFLNDVTEMIILLVAVILFTIRLLQIENKISKKP